ncbi:MAG: hypothetical protein WC796_02650 [Candidatus Pacearchaeota archaeon]|jgi:phage FluMu protein Com
MKCPKCQNEMLIKLGSKLITNGCEVLTAITTIITIRCEKCGALYQVPISGSSFMTVKKGKKE